MRVIYEVKNQLATRVVVEAQRVELITNFTFKDGVPLDSTGILVYANDGTRTLITCCQKMNIVKPYMSMMERLGQQGYLDLSNNTPAMPMVAFQHVDSWESGQVFETLKAVFNSVNELKAEIY